jgi:hypothetical protein
MDIVRSNLAEKLQVIKEAIDEASFIAFDFEFSGMEPLPLA